MRKLAENQFTITKSLFLEGMLCISPHGYGKSAGKALAVIFCIWGLFFFYCLSAGAWISAMGPLLILCVAGLWLCVGIPRSNARKAWKKLEGKYGSNLQRTTVFYPEHLEIQGESLNKRISYEEITSVLHSRRLMILVCADKTGVLVSLEGFTKGSDKDILALLGNVNYKE